MDVRWPAGILAAMLALRLLSKALLRLLLPCEHSAAELPHGVSLIAEAESTVDIGGRSSNVSVLPRDRTGRERVIVLFVPGAGGQAAQFFANVSIFLPGGALSRKAIAVLFSYPGHGSNKHTFDAASLAPAVLTNLVHDMHVHALGLLAPDARPHARVLIVSHSYGCALAPPALPRMPRVGAVLLLAPPLPQVDSKSRRLLLSLPAFVLDFLRAFDRLPRNGEPSSAPSIRRMLGAQAAREYGALQLSWNANTSSKAVTALARQAVCPSAKEYGAMLRSSGVEVTVVVGERDRITPASYGFSIASAISPKCRVVLLEGDIGHQVMYEGSDSVNDEISHLGDKLYST